MTDHFNQISVTPTIPEKYVFGIGGMLLMTRLDAYFIDGEYFFFCEDFIIDEIEYDDVLAECIENAPDDHPLKAVLIELCRGLEHGDTVQLHDIEIEQILQAIIFESEGVIKAFGIEAAATCTRVSERQVGGWCSFVTADEVRRINTGLWLNEQLQACGL